MHRMKAQYWSNLIFFSGSFRIQIQAAKHSYEFYEGMWIYVVVNFLAQVFFVFPFFLGMVMYANEVGTKEKQKLPEIKN